MINSISSSLSALRATSKKMDVTANNIANVQTDEFKKSRVTFSENENGGVTAKVDVEDTPGIPKETVRDGDIVEIESSNVDLAEELTEMIPTKAMYGANMKVVQTQDDMLGSLLDVLS